MSDFAERPGAALVVGGTGGLGRAIATLLAERGSRVAVTYRSSASAADVVVSGLGEAAAWQLDLTDAEGCVDVAAQAAAHC